MPQDHAEQKYDAADDHGFAGTDAGSIAKRRCEVDYRKGQKYAAEDQKSNGSSHSRDAYEGGNEGAYYRSDGVGCIEFSYDTTVILQAVHGVFHQRRRHGSKKEKGEHEDNDAGDKGCDDQ